MVSETVCQITRTAHAGFPSCAVIFLTVVFDIIKRCLFCVIDRQRKIQDTAEEVQVAVMKAIADMTGYGIKAVNVNVLNVDIPKAEAEK